MDKCRHFDFDQSRRRREFRNLHESTGGTRCAECFLMCSRDMIGIGKINLSPAYSAPVQRPRILAGQ